ncbi:MAG: helix-turn-helix domain-containing protein [Candidatus Binatia bacterium]
MKKTNFDRYLDKQLQNPAFAVRFKNAGEAWDVALQIAALREQAGLSQKDLAKRLKTSQQQISRLESPGLRRSFSEYAAPRRRCPTRAGAYRVRASGNNTRHANSRIPAIVPCQTR